MADSYAIVANHQGDSVVAPGALCWVTYCYGGGDQVSVQVKSRGGRWVRRDVSCWKLSNYRAKFLPPQQKAWHVSGYEKAEAESIARQVDKRAQAERARRNMREIERMAGLLDANGVRNEGRVGR